MNGLEKAHQSPPSSFLTIPNFQFYLFQIWADQIARGTNQEKEIVTVKFFDENGKQVCQ
jgi:hypothetical protein